MKVAEPANAAGLRCFASYRVNTIAWRRQSGDDSFANQTTSSMTNSDTSIPGGRSTAPAASSAAPVEAATGSCHRFENVEFDELKGELRVAGQPVDLEPRPLRLLSETLLRVNEVVTKEELFEAIWEGRPTVDHVLANAVSKLRSALGEAGSAHRYRAARGIPAEWPGTTRRYIGAAHDVCGGPNGAGA